MSSGHDLTPTVTGSPAEVRQRLTDRLFVLRSLWFPTPRELRTWNETDAKLYVRWVGDGRFEVGPRLVSMWAAAFSPVWRGDLLDTGDGHTRLQGRRRFNPITRWLLVLWWLVITAWGVTLLPRVASGEDPAVAAGWWTLMALTATGGPMLGWSMGGAALDDALPWLVEVAGDPLADQDDW